MNAQTAGDFDYDAGGGGYALQRRTDPAALPGDPALSEVLGGTSTVTPVPVPA
jgi:hypothetical protein